MHAEIQHLVHLLNKEPVAGVSALEGIIRSQLRLREPDYTACLITARWAGAAVYSAAAEHNVQQLPNQQHLSLLVSCMKAAAIVSSRSNSCSMQALSLQMLQLVVQNVGVMEHPTHGTKWALLLAARCLSMLGSILVKVCSTDVSPQQPEAEAEIQAKLWRTQQGWAASLLQLSVILADFVERCYSTYQHLHLRREARPSCSSNVLHCSSSWSSARSSSKLSTAAAAVVYSCSRRRGKPFQETCCSRCSTLGRLCVTSFLSACGAVTLRASTCSATASCSWWEARAACAQAAAVHASAAALACSSAGTGRGTGQCASASPQPLLLKLLLMLMLLAVHEGQQSASVQTL
jgi:hypothetical protein